MKDWGSEKKHVYDVNLQTFDENLVRAEKSLKKLGVARDNLHGIKQRSTANDLFEALPKIAEAINTLNKGIGGNHDFAAAAFHDTDRLNRLKVPLSGGVDFEKEPNDWCVRLLMKED